MLKRDRLEHTKQKVCEWVQLYNYEGYNLFDDNASTIQARTFGNPFLEPMLSDDPGVIRPARCGAQAC